MVLVRVRGGRGLVEVTLPLYKLTSSPEKRAVERGSEGSTESFDVYFDKND